MCHAGPKCATQDLTVPSKDLNVPPQDLNVPPQDLNAPPQDLKAPRRSCGGTFALLTDIPAPPQSGQAQARHSTPLHSTKLFRPGTPLP